jgi:hypothetical protein
LVFASAGTYYAGGILQNGGKFLKIPNGPGGQRLFF